MKPQSDAPRPCVKPSVEVPYGRRSRPGRKGWPDRPAHASGRESANYLPASKPTHQFEVQERSVALSGIRTQGRQHRELLHAGSAECPISRKMAVGKIGLTSAWLAKRTADGHIRRDWHARPRSGHERLSSSAIANTGKVVVRKTLKRSQVLMLFAKLPPCLIGVEGVRRLSRLGARAHQAWP